ncbi:class I SAM-dependent methyltransferase [Cryptosporangium phraense]|uniref:Class I SAM-dependent methyltransferase n=1 Tax=Cryptosporangium phraense TaxID=2593070 RepID=A0A545AJ58_9ACTN|nr:class I SAM-dependent methyltransferase [Cryptosporangium phraense]TQS41349.1 class I SAM-dependent methyltransferase [Cryptosporangium phraense]
MTDEWSPVAVAWARWWGTFAAPVWETFADGSRVLDVGCGSGEFLASLGARGVAGADPSPAMVQLAAAAAPGADVRVADAEALPWADDSFDLVTAINALQFADDPDAAVAEMLRVTVPGGHVAVANWAERARNDLDVINAALADEPLEDGDLRLPGGLEEMLEPAADVRSGLVEVPWTAADDHDLVAGLLFGEDDPSLARTILDAARPFRTETGGYRFVNHFRWAMGTKKPGR